MSSQSFSHRQCLIQVCRPLACVGRVTVTLRDLTGTRRNAITRPDLGVSGTTTAVIPTHLLRRHLSLFIDSSSPCLCCQKVVLSKPLRTGPVNATGTVSVTCWGLQAFTTVQHTDRETVTVSRQLNSAWFW